MALDINFHKQNFYKQPLYKSLYTGLLAIIHIILIGLNSVKYTIHPSGQISTSFEIRPLGCKEAVQDILSKNLIYMY
jgi:hypothetical protein